MTIYPSKLSGKVSAPPSKSMANRAVLCGALANGESIIKNVELSNDISAIIGAVRALGASVKITGSGRIKTLEIKGADIRENRGKTLSIDCGESGSLLRFMIPVVLAMAGGAHFEGCGLLPERPIGTYEKLFVPKGISWSHGDKNLPLDVSGKLKSGVYKLPGNISSQYITGLLFVLPMLEGNSQIVITGEFESRNYVDITVQMLSDFGVKVIAKEKGFYIPGGQRYSPAQYSVEGDWSQAPYIILAGVLGAGTEVPGLNQASLQGDKKIVDILSEMGADLRWRGDVLAAKSSELKAAKADVSQCPDLAPAIALAMACAKGRSLIYGGERLKIKESDRIMTVSNALNGIGAKVAPTGDGMIIDGVNALSGGRVDASNDHRIAMMTGVASCWCEHEINLKDSQSVNKSYPSFWEDFVILGGKIK